MGYRDEQLALRLRTEAAEKHAADAERRRLAAQAEVERLRTELAYARAAPPDVGLAAARRAFLVLLGGLASFVVLVGSSIALRAVPCSRHAAQPLMYPLPSQEAMVPLPSQQALAPEAMKAWDLHLIADPGLEMHPDAQTTLVLRRHQDGTPYALPERTCPMRVDPEPDAVGDGSLSRALVR